MPTSDLFRKDVVHPFDGSIIHRAAYGRGPQQGQGNTTSDDQERRGRTFPGRRFVLDRWAMRVAALDLGTVRVGFAVSDDLGMMAHPRPPIDGQDRKGLLVRLGNLAKEEEIDRFVVGLPLDRLGEEGPAAQRAIVFAEEVARATGCEVELQDERFTTVQAHRRLREGGNKTRKTRQRIDSASACVLLQSWLDGHRKPRK